MTAISRHNSLPSALQRLLEQDNARVQFSPGQPLCSARLLPNQIFVIARGQARVLVRENERLITLCKIGPGDIAGLASLISAESCEEISASTAVEAAALSDRQLLSLLREDAEFRQWCFSQIWPAEINRLLQRVKTSNGLSLQALPSDIGDLCDKASIVADDNKAIDQALSEGRRVFLASGNTTWELAREVKKQGETLPNKQPPLPRRWISLPSELINKLTGQNTTRLNNKDEICDLNELRTIATPMATGQSFGQSDPLKDLELIQAQGVLEEILACFQMLSKLLKLPFRRDAVERVVLDAIRRGQTPELQLLGQIGAMLGLHVVGGNVPATMGSRMQTPALVSWNQGFALAVASNAEGLTLASPSEGWVQISTDQLEEKFREGINVLLVDRNARTPEQRFGPTWFLPALSRYRGVLLQVLLSSFVVQLFTLANPLLIQVIIDKVISQRSLDTLQVLGVALVVVTIFEGVLGSLRTFLFTQTTNRIDMRLGAEVIDHLLRLPLDYFDRRPVGELGTRIAELEKIRNFLTGQALTTIIDAAFSLIYILVMALYSWVLTVVALLVVPIQVFITLVGAPLFRRQFRKAAEDNAKTQSHLVEVLTGIQTVKAQNVELVSRWKWQEFYASYINRSFEKTVTATSVRQTSQVLQKISQLLVLWVGATMVLGGELTLGQLIAFRIISGYVTQPLLRLSSIWQNIQELRVSFERLADVVDTPQESGKSDQANIPLPPVKGSVKFQDISFKFTQDGPNVIKNVNLEINQGEFVGIVGQSGSGKSTLMKLLPRLYTPNQGRILIDQYDINKVELYSLRRQIGIVPQDPLLFAGSVSDNIALTDPECNSDAVVRAAKLAGAHDFIMELPEGYSSNVGERGAALSGGQRQRIAIARTLLSNPRLLILDEATSALDYETERRVCDNLREHSQESTTFFITHRLSTIRRADRILMMHKGAIAEEGTHEELINLRGRYFALYRQQEG